MTNSSGSLKGFPQPLNVLVSGASRGIGLAFVRQLLSEYTVGQVFAAARHATHNERLKALALSDPDRLRIIDMDVSVEESVGAAAQRSRTMVSQINLIINCAGVLHDSAQMQPEKRLGDVTPANLQRSFAVNAIGPLLVAKHFRILLPPRERSIFANLSARVGSIGDNHLGGWYAYRASKAAQNMLTRNLAIELRRRAQGLICIALHPGTVDTGLSRPFQSKVPANRLFSPERAATQLLKIMDRLQPDDSGGFFSWNGERIPW